MQISEIKASLVYRGSSTRARATQRNPISEREREREKIVEDRRRKEENEKETLEEAGEQTQ